MDKTNYNIILDCGHGGVDSLGKYTTAPAKMFTFSNGEVAYELQKEGASKWVVGSTLCLNLRNINKIPAFYNPPEARRRRYIFFYIIRRFKSN